MKESQIQTAIEKVLRIYEKNGASSEGLDDVPF